MFGLSGKKDCRTCCLLVKILRKSVSTALRNSCVIDGKSLSIVLAFTSSQE